MKYLKLLAAPGSEGKHPRIDTLYTKPVQRRFIGWNLIPVQVNGEQRIAFERKTEPDIVPFHQDYVLAVKQGDLVPADEETAALCGVAFIQIL